MATRCFQHFTFCDLRLAEINSLYSNFQWKKQFMIPCLRHFAMIYSNLKLFKYEWVNSVVYCYGNCNALMVIKGRKIEIFGEWFNHVTWYKFWKYLSLAEHLYISSFSNYFLGVAVVGKDNLNFSKVELYLAAYSKDDSAIIYKDFALSLQGFKGKW